MSKYINIVLDCIFPPLCYSCFRHLEKTEKKLNVCNECASEIRINTALYCPVCKSRIPLPNYKSSESTNTNIRKFGQFVGSERSPCHPKSGYLLMACADFENPVVRELIHTFKYRKIEKAIHPITELLIKPCVQRMSKWPNVKGQMSNIVLVPIPLHKTKLRSRGFNQSDLIARSLATSLGIRPSQIISALVRTKQTDPQAETKSAKERLENVRDCFAANSQISNVKGKHIVLVDDVLTSGATLREAIKTLRKAGVRHITAFVLAKA